MVHINTEHNHIFWVGDGNPFEESKITLLIGGAVTITRPE